MRWRFVALVSLLSILFVSEGKTEIVTVTSQIRGDFVFTATEAGQTIFGAPQGVGLNISTLGNMTFSIDDTGSSTANFTSAVGQLEGISPPTPPGFLPFYITPVRFDGGTLTNIVRDGLGRIASGTVNNLAMPWEMIGTGTNTGVVLYGDQATTPLLFSGNVTLNYGPGGTSFGLGDVISGPAPFNVYLHQTGNRATQSPGTDPLVFVGSNRTLTVTAIPEPTSMGLIAATTSALVIRHRRRKLITQIDC